MDEEGRNTRRFESATTLPEDPVGENLTRSPSVWQAWASHIRVGNLASPAGRNARIVGRMTPFPGSCSVRARHSTSRIRLPRGRLPATRLERATIAFNVDADGNCFYQKLSPGTTVRDPDTSST